MNTQICLTCGLEFTPKRTDASYCSEKCRAKANYRKRVAIKDKSEGIRNIEATDSNILKAEDHPPIVKGEISLASLFDLIEKSEKEINHLTDETNKLKTLNAALVNENLSLKERAKTVGQINVEKLELALNLPDHQLFNNYLNTEYLSARKLIKSNSERLLKTEWEINSYSGEFLRQRINNYRMLLKNEILKLQGQAYNIESQIHANESHITTNKQTIQENLQQVRFYQSRIFRYEGLMVGK